MARSNPTPPTIRDHVRAAALDDLRPTVKSLLVRALASCDATTWDDVIDDVLSIYAKSSRPPRFLLSYARDALVASKTACAAQIVIALGTDRDVTRAMAVLASTKRRGVAGDDGTYYYWLARGLDRTAQPAKAEAARKAGRRYPAYRSLAATS